MESININDRSHQSNIKNNQNFSLSLRSDYYTLTWTALRNDQFIGTKIRNMHIFLTPADFLTLYTYFIIFVLVLILTIVLLLRGIMIDSVFKVGGVFMIILRMILISFAFRLISPEFMEGFYKLKYTLKNKNEFAHVGFAAMIGICQMIVTTISLFSILFWMCMADQFIQPVSGFAALSVLTCFDDWVADAILINRLKGISNLSTEEKEDFIMNIQTGNNSNTIYNNIASKMMVNDSINRKTSNLDENDEYDTTDINNRLSLVQKLSCIDITSLTLNIDKQEIYEDSALLYFIFNKIDWSILIIILVIPCSLYLPSLHKYLLYYIK